MDVTREQLAKALAKTRITIEEPEVSNSVHGGPNGWQPLSATGALKHPDEVAMGLLAQIGIARGITEDELAAEFTRSPAADPELSAMAALLPALPLVATLDRDARERVMDWAHHRACDRLPPF